MKVAVTGGSGFLGRRIVALLLEHRCPFDVEEVRILDVREPADGLGYERLRFERVDIRDADAVHAALAGIDLVIHTAAVVDWGRKPDAFVHAVNVDGTRHVLDAMKRQGCRYLVATTTMDVAWEGQAISAGDESLPYAAVATNAYCASKIAAEKLVLAQGIRARESSRPPFACVIRPMGIFGEADPYHCSQVLLSAQKGKLTARMGDGSARFSHVYVDNVAWGHLCAAAKLIEDPSVSGEAYLIGDDSEAENFFDFMEPIVRGVGHSFPPRERTVGFATALWVARISQWVSRILGPIRKVEPLMTTDSVRMLCLDFVFSDAKARRELGYAPIVTPEDAIDRTTEWFRTHGPVSE